MIFYFFFHFIFFSRLFTAKNSSLLKYESVKALEIITSTVFNLLFAKNTFLSCFFFFFFIIDLYFLIPAVIAKIIISTPKPVIPIGIVTNETNAKTETQPGTVETKKAKL